PDCVKLQGKVVTKRLAAKTNDPGEAQLLVALHQAADLVVDGGQPVAALAGQAAGRAATRRLQHRHPGPLVALVALDVHLGRRLLVEQCLGLSLHGDLRDITVLLRPRSWPASWPRSTAGAGVQAMNTVIEISYTGDLLAHRRCARAWAYQKYAGFHPYEQVQA